MEITIHSVIEELNDAGLCLGEPEINITTLPATVEMRGADRVIRYSEEQEGVRIESEIVLSSDGSVSMMRRGGIEWCVRFAEGEEHTSLYRVPPYSFDCSVATKRVTVTEEGEALRIRLVYTMELGGGKKEVKMRIGVK